MLDSASIFSEPYKYRQSDLKNNLENYLTEIFAGTLRKDIGFFNSFLSISNISVSELTISEIITQNSYTTANGDLRPDIEIRLDNTIILVECKVESKESVGQLKRYADLLMSLDYSKKYLLYLTKYPEKVENLFEEKINFKQMLWSDVSNIARTKGTLAKELSLFLTDKKIDMPNDFTHLDALVLENVGEVFTKSDIVLERANNYNNSRLNFSLGGGRNVTWIKQFGYYIHTNRDGIEYMIGFFKSPLELRYIIQSKEPLPRNLISLSDNNGWDKTEYSSLFQIIKSRAVSEFMSNLVDTTPIDSMINFIKIAIDEIETVVNI
jgi:hypothetical protein